MLVWQSVQVGLKAVARSGSESDMKRRSRGVAVFQGLGLHPSVFRWSEENETKGGE